MSKEYYPGILYMLEETITVHYPGSNRKSDTWEKDEKFLAYKEYPRMGVKFKSLNDGSELSLAVIRKLERGFKKPLFKSIGEAFKK